MKRGHRRQFRCRTRMRVLLSLEVALDWWRQSKEMVSDHGSRLRDIILDVRSGILRNDLRSRDVGKQGFGADEKKTLEHG